MEINTDIPRSSTKHTVCSSDSCCWNLTWRKLLWNNVGFVLGATSIKRIRDFLQWSRIFIEFSDFSEFRESDKSLNHELGSV